jgi:hypothetical protein
VRCGASFLRLSRRLVCAIEKNKKGKWVRKRNVTRRPDLFLAQSKRPTSFRPLRNGLYGAVD